MAITKEQLDTQIADSQHFYSKLGKKKFIADRSSIQEDVLKRMVYYPLDNKTKQAGEVKSLADFYSGLQEMPLDQAEQELNQFTKGFENQDVVVCGISQKKGSINVLTADKDYEAFSPNNIVESEARYKEKFSPDTTPPKPLNWFQELWNSICMSIWNEPSAAGREYNRKYGEATDNRISNDDLAAHNEARPKAKYGLDPAVVEKIDNIYKEKGIAETRLLEDLGMAKRTNEYKKTLENERGDPQLSSEEKADIYTTSTPEQRYKSLFSKNTEITAFNKKGYNIAPDLFKNTADLSMYTNTQRINPEVDEAIRLLCTMAVNSPRSNENTVGNTSGPLMDKRLKLPDSLADTNNPLKAALTVDIIMEDVIGGKDRPESRGFSNAILQDGKNYYDAAVKDDKVLAEGVVTGMFNLAASLSTTPPEDFLNPNGVATLKLKCMQKGFDILNEKGLDVAETMQLSEEKLAGLAPWLYVAEQFEKSQTAQKNFTRKNNDLASNEDAYKDIMLESSLRAVLYTNAKSFQERETTRRTPATGTILPEVKDTYPSLEKIDAEINHKKGINYYTQSPASAFLVNTLTPENIDKMRDNVAPSKILKSIDSLDKVKALTTPKKLQEHTNSMISAFDSIAKAKEPTNLNATSKMVSEKTATKEKSSSGRSL